MTGSIATVWALAWLVAALALAAAGRRIGQARAERR
jgi:hypothetical protein